MKNFFTSQFKNSKIMIFFIIALSLLYSLISQSSLEITILRLIISILAFKTTSFIMETNPIYKKKITSEESSNQVILEEQNFVSKKVDSFLSHLGGEPTTFQLNTLSYRFCIIKPTIFNLPYILFCRLNKYSWFKRIFQIILMYPYFITEVWIGKTLFGINFFILVLYPNIISMVVLIESFFYFLALIIFFRFEGVYQYCIDTYGTEFVEKYIGNPGSASFMKKLGSKVVVFSATAVVGAVAAVAIDITDQSYRNDMCDKKLDAMIAKHEKLGHTITSDELKVMRKDISKENLTLLKQVTKAVLE